MSRAAIRSARISAAAALALALTLFATVTARPAAAASDQVVLSEFLARCYPSQGIPDQAFLEFTAIAPGQTLDPAVGVRTRDVLGYVLADLPSVFAAHAGEPLAEGQHMLVASAAFASATGVAPDVVLDLKLWPAGTNGGSFEVYRSEPDGSVTVLQQVRFVQSSFQPGVFFTEGRSYERQPDGSFAFAGESSPTARSGSVGRLNGCAQLASDRRLFVSSFALTCLDGDPRASMVVVRPGFGNTPDPDLRLRVSDHTGARLFEQPLFDPARDLAFVTQPVLFGTTAFTDNGVPPDWILPVILDPEGGRFEVLGSDASGSDVVLDSVRYGHGPNDELPPAPGSMKTRDVYFGGVSTFREEPIIQSGDRLGRPHLLQGCPQRSLFRIAAVFAECATSGLDGRYVAIRSDLPGEVADTSMFVEMFDATGAPLGRQSLFMPSPPPSFSYDGTWLLGGPALGTPFGVRADAELTLPVPTEGSLVLSRADPLIPGQSEELDRVVWGAVSPWPALPVGQELRFYNRGLAQLSDPHPQNHSGVLLNCGPSPADTAISVVPSSAIVTLQCLDGSTHGQFVGLTTVYGALLDTSFVLRLYDHSGALAGETARLFGSYAQHSGGTPWLVGGPDLAAVADAVLPAPLDTLGGRLEVVWRRSGVERARWQVTYPGASTIPRGYAANLFPGEPPALTYATAYDRTGIWHPLPGCHGEQLRFPSISLAAWFPGCADGTHDLDYLLINTLTPPGGLLPRLELEAQDASGRVLMDVPDFLPPRMPASARSDQLLIAGPGFEQATGVAPDITLPAPIPAGTWSFTAYFGDPISPRNPQTLTFMPEALPPGLTFAADRSAALLGWGIHSTVRRSDGTTARLPAACLPRTLAAPFRLDQISLGCLDGNARGQYMQLAHPDPGAWLLSGTRLEWLDRAGARLGVAVLAASEGPSGPAPPGLRHLLAPLGSPLLDQGAEAFASGLDTLAGSFRLLAPTDDGFFEYWRERYTRDVPDPPPLGDAFQPNGDTVWTAVPSAIFNRFGQPVVVPGCFAGSPPVDLVVRQVMGACAGGSMSRCFVELMAPTNTFRTGDVGLRVMDADATREVFPLFSSATVLDAWPAGRRYLVATDSFQVATGVAPDAILPVPFGLKPVTLEVFQRDLRHGTERVITTMALDFVTRPSPATAWQLSPAGFYTSTSTPDPQNYAQVPASLGPDCIVGQGVGSSTAVQLAGVMLRCRDGETGAQFVQFDRTSALATQSAALQLRVYASDGHELGRTADLYRAHPGPLWGPVTSFVAGGPQFAARYGIAPDVPLPAALDTLGGLIQLVLPGVNGEQVVSQMAYGDATLPLAPPGTGWRFLGGRWQTEARLAPVTSAGTGIPGADCVEGCESQELTYGLGTPTLSDADRDSASSLGSTVVFDVPHQTFDVRSSGYTARIALRDRFRLEGATTDTTLFATLRWNGARRDTCFAARCASTVRRLSASLDGASADTLPANAGASGSLRVAVRFRAGREVLLRISAEVLGVSAFNMTGRLSGQLVFDTPPPGLRVRSCRGYDSDRDRFVVSASGESAPREARLEWRTFAPRGFEFEVLRQSSTANDTLERSVAVVGAEADGLVRFLDARVVPGGQYRYRLRWPEGDSLRVSEPVTLAIPASTGFALLGAWPNPSHGTLRVALSLPEPAEARLEVFDLLGRRVREARATLPQGIHQLSADGGRALPAGVYRVRLRADSREAHLNVVVLP